MGTPEFAVTVLDRIIAAGHDVVGVVTTPDKPAGRGQRIHFSDVKGGVGAYGRTLAHERLFEFRLPLNETPGIQHISKNHRRAQEDIVLHLNTRINGHIILHLHMVTNRNTLGHKHILTKIAVLAYFAMGHKMRKVPNSSTVANLAIGIYNSGGMDEWVHGMNGIKG